MVYANHMSYKGEWVCDKKSGSGLFAWAEGSMYHGSFLNDMAEGKGKIAFVREKPGNVKEQVLFEEYWIKGVAIRILSTHLLPTLSDPKKIVPGDMVSTTKQLI